MPVRDAGPEPTRGERLEQVARVPAVDVDDVASRLSLDVAVPALDAVRAGATAAGSRDPIP